MKKLMSLAMLVLLLGASATTVIPKTTTAPTVVAQTTSLSDEQLDGVAGGYDDCFCSQLSIAGFKLPVYLQDCPVSDRYSFWIEPCYNY